MYSTLRTLDNPEDLDRYLTLKAERKRLDAEIKDLEPVIYSSLLDEDGSTFERSGLTLSVRTRRSYEYSPAVEALADELAARKRYEERVGLAACTRATGYVEVRSSQPR